MHVAVAALAAVLAAARVPHGPCVRVLVPCFMCKDTLGDLLLSVRNNAQHHWCVSVVVAIDWEDGDHTIRGFVTQECSGLGLQCTAMGVDSRYGPAHTKYRLFAYAADSFGANDLVMVVDGDDTFDTDTAVATVVGAMEERGAWVSTGMIRGLYAEECARPWEAHVEMRRAKWSFCHPRTMRAGLLKFFDKGMFTMDGGWLEKATDRAWLYAAVDKATRSRFVKVLKQPLVAYTSRSDSTASRVSFEYKQKALNVTASTPVLAGERTIHVVSIVHSRLYFLNKWVQHNIMAQARAVREGGWSICVHFVAQSEEAGRAAAHACHALVNLVEVRCVAETHHENEGPWLRYDYIRRLSENVLLDYVVMIDDDLALRQPDGLMKAWHHRVARGMACWYGKIFGREDDYWTDRYKTNDMRGAMNVACPEVVRWDYCGAGFAIVDATFFATFRQLEDATPKEYRFVEDLASSWMLTQMGWSKRRLFAEVEDMNYNDTHSSEKNGLWFRSFMREKKTGFFEHLKRKGWKFQHNASVLEACTR